MFCLGNLHNQGAPHHRTQPRLQDRVEAATRSQFSSSEAPGESLGLRNTLSLTDNM